MKLMTPQQMKQIDTEAIRDYDIPGILLMEHAAYEVFKVLERHTEEKSGVIICGPGNNGGDGLALARQILSWSSKKVTLVMLAQREQLTEDGKVYYDICKKLAIPMLQLEAGMTMQVEQLIKEADYIVDAVFGTGLNRAVEGIFKEMLELMNASKALKLAVDIPSGINGSSGQVMGAAFKADYTISFAMPKLGLYLYPAIDYVGELSIVDIGIPKAITEKMTTSYYTIELEDFKLPKRPTRSNKGTYGKVLVVGGKRGLSGAPVMTSMAALKVGAGLVTAAVPESIHDIMEAKLTEVMTLPFKDDEGEFGDEAPEALEKIIGQYTVCAIGPGLGRNVRQKRLVLEGLKTDKPCVLDADALFFVPELIEVIRTRRGATILTPHPGEMARMTGLTIDEIMKDPITIARKFALENNVILILKIERIVIADRSGDIYINRRGNPGMAKGGSGDLLTGVITGLVAQGFSPLEAAKLGCYIHGEAGDLARDKKTEYTFLPTDLYKEIDNVFKKLIVG